MAVGIISLYRIGVGIHALLHKARLLVLTKKTWRSNVFSYRRVGGGADFGCIVKLVCGFCSNIRSVAYIMCDEGVALDSRGTYLDEHDAGEL
jgi:hypothetical protein